MALLEQQQVMEALESVGVDVSTLKTAAHNVAARYRFETDTYSETMATYRAIVDQESIPVLQSRQLLVMLAQRSPKLRARGVSPVVLEQRLSLQGASDEEYWRERLVTEGWDELSSDSPGWGRYPLSLQRESYLGCLRQAN